MNGDTIESRLWNVVHCNCRLFAEKVFNHADKFLRLFIKRQMSDLIENDQAGQPKFCNIITEAHTK